MTRNLVAPETAERNRSGDTIDVLGGKGGYTFHAPVADEYDGLTIVWACVRLGDHAHVDVWSGRHVPAVGGSGGTQHRGKAGHLIFRWEEWLVLRDALVAWPMMHIAEVENPTDGQLQRHTLDGGAA